MPEADSLISRLTADKTVFQNATSRMPVIKAHPQNIISTRHPESV
ncbi:hypothetical protein PANA5342_2624 [Pantoea ananatis LMG 5342]|nr:hypothetical protein PANA5342_2624 [Pantoea ananatis LMG 5342]